MKETSEELLNCLDSLKSLYVEMRWLMVSVLVSGLSGLGLSPYS